MLRLTPELSIPRESLTTDQYYEDLRERMQQRLQDIYVHYQPEEARIQHVPVDVDELRHESLQDIADSIEKYTKDIEYEMMMKKKMQEYCANELRQQPMNELAETLLNHSRDI